VGNLGLTLFFLGAYIIVPVFIAKVFCGASWRAIGIAYATYVGLMLLGVVGSLPDAGETAGMMIILALFLTWIVIPGLTVMLRKYSGIR
jgi:hypothetical protein